jgi:hypothetical protein
VSLAEAFRAHKTQFDTIVARSQQTSQRQALFDLVAGKS